MESRRHVKGASKIIMMVFYFTIFSLIVMDSRLASRAEEPASADQIIQMILSGQIRSLSPAQAQLMERRKQECRQRGDQQGLKKLQDAMNKMDSSQGPKQRMKTSQDVNSNAAKAVLGP